eukprot:446384-Prorocentrum_minimum.AAC.9
MAATKKDLRLHIMFYNSQHTRHYVDVMCAHFGVFTDAEKEEMYPEEYPEEEISRLGPDLQISLKEEICSEQHREACKSMPPEASTEASCHLSSATCHLPQQQQPQLAENSFLLRKACDDEFGFGIDLEQQFTEFTKQDQLEFAPRTCSRNEFIRRISDKDTLVFEK